MSKLEIAVVSIFVAFIIAFTSAALVVMWKDALSYTPKSECAK
jgi:hypothetical protein